MHPAGVTVEEMAVEGIQGANGGRKRVHHRDTENTEKTKTFVGSWVVAACTHWSEFER
jgi:hypothetical protein